MRLIVLQKLFQFFHTKDYKIQKILEDINFILHLSYLSDIFGVMNHCNCYLQRLWSNIVNFAIKFTTSGVSKVRLAIHMQLFDPRDVALQFFVKNTEDLFFVLQLHLHPSFTALGRSKTLFFRWQLFDCSAFPQVALSIKIMPTLTLPSSKSSFHDNDSHMVRFLQSLNLCCPDAKPQCYLLCASAYRTRVHILRTRSSDS